MASRSGGPGRLPSRHRRPGLARDTRPREPGARVEGAPACSKPRTGQGFHRKAAAHQRFHHRPTGDGRTVGTVEITPMRHEQDAARCWHGMTPRFLGFWHSPSRRGGREGRPCVPDFVSQFADPSTQPHRGEAMTPAVRYGGSPPDRSSRKPRRRGLDELNRDRKGPECR